MASYDDEDPEGAKGPAEGALPSWSDRYGMFGNPMLRPEIFEEDLTFPSLPRPAASDGPQFITTPVNLATPAYLTPGWNQNPGPGYAGPVNLDPATHISAPPVEHIGHAQDAHPSGEPEVGQSGAVVPYDMSITHRLEGRGRNPLVPYVLPPEKFPSSGATIGYGIDLSRLTVSDLRQMRMSEQFISQVSPFLAPEPGSIKEGGPVYGVTGKTAKGLEKPLLNPDDIDKLQQAVDARMAKRTRNAYDAANPVVRFDDLDPAQRAALIDMGFNRGPRFGYRKDGLYKDLWADITAGNWDNVLARLDSDTSSFAARSRQQACILRTGAPCSPSSGKR